MFYKTRWHFSVISHRRVKPLRWEMTEKRLRVLQNIFNYLYRYDSMFIKDLVMWLHIRKQRYYYMRPWQRLAISDNWNHLSAYVIWNILVLNIKGKINKIAINSKLTKLTNLHNDNCMASPQIYDWLIKWIMIWRPSYFLQNKPWHLLIILYLLLI